MDQLHEANTATESLTRLLEPWRARDLILRFDADFDVPFAHGLCIGLLEMLGAYEERPAQDLLSRAEWVGAYWCRIIRADVTWRLPEGLDLIGASRETATELKERLAAGELGLEDRAFLAYVIARWHDGTGKIAFRCADYSNARLNFDIAKEIAEAEGLWYCFPDIVSNWLRADYEERTLAAHAVDLAAQYRECIGKAEAEALGRGIPTEADAVTTATASRLTAGHREFLRGLSSLHHNLALELKRAASEKGIAESFRDERLEASRHFSRKSETICRALGDGYRLGQALNHQAFLIRERGRSDRFHLARELFEEVLLLPGNRARRIASQNLASMDLQAERLSEAHARLEQLVEELRADRRRRGGDLGLDNLFQYETVQRWREVLAAPRARIELGEEPWQIASADAEKEHIESVRSIRRVVKISQYKQSFSLRHYPFYLGLIGQAVRALRERGVGEHEWLSRADDVCARVEEASSRELMDLLQAVAQVDVVLPKLPPTGPIKLPAVAGVAEQAERRRGSVLSRRLAETDEAGQRVFAALDQRRAAYERHSLRHPLPTAPYNAEVAHDLSIFTANNPRLIVVRYFLFRYAEAQSDALAAFVFRDGKAQFFQLDWEAIKTKLLAAMDTAMPESPAPLARDEYLLFKLLIQPWWSLVEQSVRMEECLLVLIPTDELFRVPLHVALPGGLDGMPLCSVVPTVYSVSASAFLYRGRHLLRKQRVDKADDLCAVLYRDEEVSCEELVDLEWPKEHFFVAGSPPDGIGSHSGLGQANWEALDSISHQRPEFFVYSGHGVYYPQFGVLGPALLLEDDAMTQYDVAMRLRLRHNKLTLLGACVSGQGSNLGAGEVSGFLRAFMTAGSGALGVTLWPVLDSSMASAMRHLLRAAQEAVSHDCAYDVVQALFDYYRGACRATRTANARIEACPIALYL